MSGDIWFKLYAAEFLSKKKVRDLSLEMQAVLVRLWCALCIDGELSADVEQLAAQSQVPLIIMRKFCDLHMRTFFNLHESRMWISKRMEEEKSRSAINRANALKRWGQKNQQVNANGCDLHDAVSQCPEAEEEYRSKNKNITTTPPTPSKRRRRKAAEVIAGFSEAVAEVVNPLFNEWPKKQPKDGKQIHVDAAQFASRVDHILTHSGATAQMLLECARDYLSQPKTLFKAPQHFFGKPNGEEPPWYEYARMVKHRHQQAAATEQASDS